ncbi:predicted protein [Uncinocarpus reesii 1704]|uniref:Uncharacterized protein n=1 Tax=Uncinocarpus reesii (strain UAMH 1704) TaxID=336963 RepID=C4JEI2_UNCRE|nr:uncharacterized protein UREG_00821 [Uncinocarpus reesii 1704]EEP75974.1 predicted protein [Uncinocarpus reesii 1704]
MKSPTTWKWLLALAVGMLPAAVAELCTPTSGDYGRVFYVYSQSDLDTIAAKCTTVDGSIFIGTNYTGSFRLPNVRNITSAFQQEPSFPHKSDPAPTSIDIPDLEYLGGSLIVDFPTVAKLSAPKLKKVHWELRVQDVATVDFRSLEEARYISVSGNITSLNLDSLRRFGERCKICNKEYCGPTTPPNYPPLDLSLPSLQTMGDLTIEGRLSSFNIPKLSNLTALDEGYIKYNFDLRLAIHGDRLNVSFPELSTSNLSFFISGDIARYDLSSCGTSGAVAYLHMRISLSMPKMIDRVPSITVTSSTPLDINLPFQKAEFIGFFGNISRGCDTVQIL